MGLREALRRADTAVQETRESVITSAVLAVAAIVVAAVALVVAVVTSR
jgi:hypothetical protein